MKKLSFKGGIHPEDGKYLSRDILIEAYTPKQVIVPLVQHIGAPAKVVVNDGDHVKKGQLIADAAGAVSAKVHAPVSGTVKLTEAQLAFGRKCPAILIENDLADEWIERKENEDYLSLSSEQIRTIISDAGIVGMGGAAFPTHVKINPPKGKQIDSLIINGVECEPYLTSDYRLMVQYGKEVIEGVKILLQCLNLKKAYIGIEANKPEAIRIFRDLTKTIPSITVHSLKVKYPQGAEKVLIKSILNREVPPGGLPMDVGVVVQNVGTAFAVFEAVRYGKPLIERIVTITGEAISNPKNFKVPLGTSVSELIQACGGIKGEQGGKKLHCPFLDWVHGSGSKIVEGVKIISGGPMMGFALYTTDIPVTKGTSGIVVLPKEKAAGNEDFGPCIKCGKCLNVCPMGLQPSMLGILAEKRMYEQAKEYNIENCFECGSCTYNCPSRRPMVQLVKTAKVALKG